MGGAVSLGRFRRTEDTPGAVASYGGSDGIYIMHDLELVTAIDAWKQRQLDEIDTQIRKLGAVDADALMAEIDRARMDYEMNERQLSKPS